MVAKKKDRLITENDRLKAQLLNVVLDRAQTNLINTQLQLKNAQLAITIAQRDVDTANADLHVFGKELEQKYKFDMKTASVNWESGEIKRSDTDGEG
jgi:hypothetical protein